MSAKGQLLDAILAYSRELRGQPGKSDELARLEELRRDIEKAPDPHPGGGVPALHGESTSDRASSPQPSINVQVGWPSRSTVLGAMRGATSSGSDT